MRSEHKELLSVKEFAALTGIEESTLRYWDRIGVFQPSLRHEENNYRLPPRGDYLVGYVQGYYGQWDDLPGRLATYAEENGLECEGPVYAIWLLDEICIQNPAEYLAQVSVRVRKRKSA